MKIILRNITNGKKKKRFLQPFNSMTISVENNYLSLCISAERINSKNLSMKDKKNEKGKYENKNKEEADDKNSRSRTAPVRAWFILHIRSRIAQAITFAAFSLRAYAMLLHKYIRIALHT